MDALRVGLGYDLHRLEPGGPLQLGGVTIAHDRHAVGHSDADVLLHAITDALLGAAALGDIGELFPDTSDENAGRDSGEMLAIAYQHVTAAGWRLVNLDCVVQAQRPKLLGYRTAIRQRIGELLGVGADCVWLKAKTGESTGEIGNEQAIAAHCVALLAKRD